MDCLLHLNLSDLTVQPTRRLFQIKVYRWAGKSFHLLSQVKTMPPFRLFRCWRHFLRPDLHSRFYPPPLIFRRLQIFPVYTAIREPPLKSLQILVSYFYAYAFSPFYTLHFALIFQEPNKCLYAASENCYCLRADSLCL